MIPETIDIKRKKILYTAVLLLILFAAVLIGGGSNLLKQEKAPIITSTQTAALSIEMTRSAFPTKG